MKVKRYLREILALFSIVLLSLSQSSTVRAFEIQTGNEDIKINWDTTFKYSNITRTAKRNPALLSGGNITKDEGDRNFNRSLAGVSNRVDILSEADVMYHGYGARVSGAGWYDTVYHHSNKNDSPPGTFNHPSSLPHNEFASGTKVLMGRDAELLDAFVFGTGDQIGVPYEFRIGRHTLMWGESLFFTNNGVANGMAAVDSVKGNGSPGSLAKELFMPTNQVSASVSILKDLTLMAYYQLEWRNTRIAPSGSYFSTNDTLDKGGEVLIGARRYNRKDDIKPPNSGQYGVGAMTALGKTSIGLYFVQFDAKNPTVYIYNSDNTYRAVYPQNTNIYAMSFNTQIGNMNTGAEIGYHTNQPFLGTSLSPFEAPTGPVTAASDASNNPAYPVGKSAHAQLSVVAVPQPFGLWDTMPISFEIAGNRRLSVQKNARFLNTDSTRDFAMFQIQFSPQWFQVLEGVDLTFPLTFSNNCYGRSSIDPIFKGAGKFSVGATAKIRARTTVNLTYLSQYGGTHVYGSNIKNNQIDRDFVSFYIAYTL